MFTLMIKINLLKRYFRILIKPKRLVTIYRHYKYNRLFADQSATIGFDTLISSTQLGEYVSIGDNCQIENSTINRHSYIGGNTKIANTSIGAFCSISFDVSIGLSLHPSNMVSTHPAFYSKTKGFKTFADSNYFEESGRITIGNDVLIGKNAVVMYGVHIGDGAIITNNAVVTKDVPPYAIVGGIPAKLIKYRFDEITIKHIRESKWWDWDDREFEAHFKEFQNPDAFLNYYM